MTMLHSELNMAASVDVSDIDTFLTDVAWAIHSTYHTVLKASPGAAIFGWDMLFDIPFLAGWNKIGGFRQCQKDLNIEHESRTLKDWGYQVGHKGLQWKHGILCTESQYECDPWTLTSAHTMIQIGFNTEQNQED
jgi:hypothetical protein